MVKNLTIKFCQDVYCYITVRSNIVHEYICCGYRAKSQLGSCVRVVDGVRQALHKAVLLFSLPILAFEDMNEPQSVM